jgi:hypothetical protein
MQFGSMTGFEPPTARRWLRPENPIARFSIRDRGERLGFQNQFIDATNPWSKSRRPSGEGLSCESPPVEQRRRCYEAALNVWLSRDAAFRELAFAAIVSAIALAMRLWLLVGFGASGSARL